MNGSPILTTVAITLVHSVVHKMLLCEFSLHILFYHTMMCVQYLEQQLPVLPEEYLQQQSTCYQGLISDQPVYKHIVNLHISKLPRGPSMHNDFAPNDFCWCKSNGT